MISSVVSPSFQGVQKTEKGNVYNKSNAGVATGAVVGGASLAYWGLSSFGVSFIEKSFEQSSDFFDEKSMGEMKKTLEGLKKQKKFIPLFATIAAACSVGCGYLVDKMRNKKSAELADNVAECGLENLPENYSDKVLISNNKVSYYGNEGKSNGALLGLGCGLAHNLMIKKPANLFTYILFALGGLACGAITDSVANGND